MIEFMECRSEWDQNNLEIPIDKKTFLDDCYFDFQKIQEAFGSRYLLQVHPKQNLNFKSVKCRFAYNFANGAKHFSNGFQSRSLGQLVDKKRPTQQQRDKGISKDILPKSNSNESWSYGFVKSDGKYLLLGSLNESSGFTTITYEKAQNVIEVSFDCKDLKVEHSFTLLELWIAEGQELKELTQHYFSKLKSLKTDSLLIQQGFKTEVEFDKALKTISDNQLPIDSVLISPESHSTIGDWLSPDSNNFPNGFAQISRQIKSAKLIPAYWIAPLIVSENSDVFRKNKDWLLKDQSGKFIKIQDHVRWGSLYALDFYHTKVQEYLIGVFHKLIEHWGIELFYVDYLFVASLGLKESKTKGQQVSAFIEFIRSQVSDNKIIAGRTPLGSAFSLVEYAEVGNAILTKRKNSWFNLFGKSLPKGINIDFENFIARNHLDDKAFGNILGILQAEENASLATAAKYSIIRLQALLGSTSFLNLNMEELRHANSALKEINQLRQATSVTFKELGDSIFEVLFEVNGKKGRAWFNFSSYSQKFIQGEISQTIAPNESHVIFH